MHTTPNPVADAGGQKEAHASEPPSFAIRGPWTNQRLIVVLPREMVDPAQRELLAWLGPNPIPHARAYAMLEEVA